ncbi:cytochrome P450 [Arthrobacter castelli]|uniref:cytochrome P450 n=1 Tax=Arthrobacter castelli TaxID=271431 RepID=UPI0003F857A2|nr:cytochrome P450 [Arthrobacter castelli]
MGFLRDGYAFISSRCDRLGTDAFRTRIAGRPVICMRGAEAARLFYDGNRFTRAGALPPNTVRLLQDRGSVQTLDGEAHRHRKAMFMSLMTVDSLDWLVEIFEQTWHSYEGLWRQFGRIVLHHQIRKVLTKTACEWAGIPLQEPEVTERAREFSMMIDQAGSFGPANWYALLKRRGTEKWARSVVDGVRDGTVRPPEGSALATIADYRDEDGGLLSADAATVELLNVLRPIVAVARFIVFAAVALEQHAGWKERFASGEQVNLEPFAQEVRRYFPYFPAVGGTATEGFSFGGSRFEAGTWVLLDLYGTNHHSGIRENPETFSPERFHDWDNNPYTLVPQGAGIVDESHRCPGERITVELIKKATQLLSTTDFTVPAQDLTFSLDRIPAVPNSGFVLQAPGYRKSST